MTRTDIHSPSRINPADYNYMGSFDMGAEGELEGYPSQDVLNQLHDDRRAYPSYPSKCDHCGQSLRYIVVWEHVDNYLIVTGQVCAHETMEVPSRMDLDQKRLREAAATRKENERRRVQVATELEETRSLYPEAVDMLLNYDGDNYFIENVADRLKQWGNITERQAESTLEAYQRENQVVEVEEEELKPVPTGKVRIEGEVVSEYWKENAYGSRHVMIVKGDGWKVWGSVPNSLESSYDYDTNKVTPGIDKGDRVAFTATVTVSDDESFGFYKRPTKPEITERG